MTTAPEPAGAAVTETEARRARELRVRDRMAEAGIDALLLSVGADLPYLTGYEAPPLERLTMYVLPAAGPARLFVPRLECRRVACDGQFELVPWDETEDPVRLVAGAVGRASRVAVGDQTWARFLLALQDERPGTRFESASRLMGPLRAVKDEAEVAALRRVAGLADAVAVEMREWRWAGRTERDLQRDLAARLREVGHDRVGFAIVATGENAASPHHDPGDRIVERGDVVVCDFGGPAGGYWSDITRVFHVGEPPIEVARAYDVLRSAQEAGVSAARVGTSCGDVDAAARDLLVEAGYGDRFVHRLGHGIGREAHEDPYLVAGSSRELVAGMVFSVEPGVYFEGRFGLRIEDIVVATPAGPQRLNVAPRDLAVVT